MTPKQAKQLLLLAFYQQSLAGQIMKGSDPALVASLRKIAGLIQVLPPEGDLLREQAWKKLKPQIMAELESFSGQFGEEVITALKSQAVVAEEFARDFIVAGPDKKITPATLASPGPGPAVSTLIFDKDLPVSTGKIYFNAIAQTDVVGQKFTKLFGKTISEAGGILTVAQPQTGMARFFMTSIDRMVTEGILTGQPTEAIAQNLIFDSIKGGLNLGKTARQLKSQATTVARTATANALNRAHEAFWDANNKWEWDDPETGEHHKGNIIVGWVFDAVTDSRACPECAMYDQKFATRRGELPSTPLHPRCRCIRRPVSEVERALMKEDQRSGQQSGGTGIKLYRESELPGKRAGESAKDFIKRKRQERNEAIANGKDVSQRWYATPVVQNGEKFYRMAEDLPAFGKQGVVRVPEWLSGVNKTTQVEFFGGARRPGSANPSPGEIRQAAFSKLIDKGVHPREALNKLLSVDRVDGVKRYRFKAAGALL